MKRILIGLLSVCAIALLAYGAWGLWNQYAATNNPTPTIPEEVITYSDDEPDETPIDEVCDSYEVTSDLPRTITIKSIGVDACIQRVGVDASGAVAVPTNIHLAGWYVESALPGSNGISLIDGHVLGRYGDAIFANLKQVEMGDSIAVEMGDGTVHSYAVQEVSTHSVEETMPVALAQLDNAEKQLSLITCDGVFDEATQTYDRRLVVRATMETP